MDLPATMLDCRLQFQDDEACQAYRETIRWPNGKRSVIRMFRSAV